MSVQIITGDCRETLKTLADESIHCCVTSPPYWGLRDYGHDGQIGLESTPDAYVAEMVEVFREVKRVLRDDGTLWLNLGDSYNSQGGHTQIEGDGRANRSERSKMKGANVDGLKPKDLVGIPWRVAFALQADGWYLRQDIIWHKPNPMPESVTDRCTKAHEYIFLLSKSERYHYDQEAIKEPATCGRLRGSGPMVQTGTGRNDHAEAGDHRVRPSKKRGEFNGKTEATPGANAFRAVTDYRNKRSVWTVQTYSYADAHFATFPPDLIRPCILAGCPVGGTVLDPFGGSGTTGMVATELGRQAILCELNPEYVKLIEHRTNVTPGLALA